MGGGEIANPGWRGAKPFVEELLEGAIGAGRCDELDDGEGTCWNARVTSYEDILVHGPELDGGGVSPSSDLTSCSVKGTPVRSSAMPLSELTG